MRITTEIVQNLTDLRRTLTIMPLKAESQTKRKKCLNQLADIRVLANQVEDVEFDREQLMYLRNKVTGVFDGLKDRPIQKQVLTEAIEDVDSQLESLIVSWQQIDAELASEEPVEQEVEKKAKPKTTTHSWQDGLAQLQQEIGTPEDEETEEEIQAAPTERPDAETVNEEDWEEDTEKLRDFQKTKARLLRVARQEALSAPIIIAAGLQKVFVEKLEENQYKVDRIFGLYSIIKNMTLVGFDTEYLEKRGSPVEQSKYVEQFATKQFKRKMHIVSHAVENNNHTYYAVLPNTIPSSLTLLDWTFHK